MSISKKIMASFLFVGAFIITLLFLAIINSKNTLQASLVDHSLLFATNLLKNIDRRIYNRLENLLEYSTNSQIVQFVINSNQSFERMGDVTQTINRRDREWMTAVQETGLMKSLINNHLSQELRKKLRYYLHKYGYKLFAEIFVTNRFGANVAQTDRTSDYRQDDEAWWQHARKEGFFLKDVEYDQSAKVYSVDVAVAVKDQNQRFIGVLKASVNIEEVSQIISQLRPEKESSDNKTNQYHLLNRNDQIIFSTAHFNTLQSASDLIPKKQSRGFFIREDDSRGQLLSIHVYSKGYREFDGFGWKLLIEHPVDEIFSPVQQMVRNTIIISILFALITILAAWFIARSITRPLKMVIEAAQKVAEGDLDVHIGMSGTDETGQLLASIKNMMSYIREIAKVVDEIADGNLNIEIIPKSDHDVLNLCLAQTIDYLNKAAQVAQSISEGHLGIDIQPRSDRDIFNSAFAKMIANLRNIIIDITDSSALVASTVEQLSKCSQQIGNGAQDQSSVSEDTSASMDQMAASIRQVDSHSHALTDSVHQTSSSIRQMTMSIQSVAQNISALASSVDDTSTAIDQMAGSNESIAQSAMDVSQSSKEAVFQAQEGSQTVENAVASMHQIAESMQDTVDVIKKLEQSSRKIDTIVDVIEDITKQTNLLAINAALLAAHAGEQGRSFGVVADEVRSLSERSADSVKEIVQLTKEIQKNTKKALQVTEEGHQKANQGAQLASQASEALRRISKSINDVDQLMTKVRHATDQQTNASDHIVRNIEKIRAMSRDVNLATQEQQTDTKLIMQSVEVMNQMTQRVSISTKEQKLSTDRVVEAMVNVASISSQNKQSAAQISQVTQQLSVQAEKLRRIINNFTGMR